MALSVRMMVASEIDILDEYFQNSTPEHLEMLGVNRRVCPAGRPGTNDWSASLTFPSRNDRFCT